MIPRSLPQAIAVKAEAAREEPAPAPQARAPLAMCCGPSPKIARVEPGPVRVYDRDVLIAGAGPAGLMTAILLVEYGVPPERIEIVDAKKEPDTRTKATTLQPGVMRILEQAGVLDRIREHAVPVDRSSVRAAPGAELAHVDFSELKLINIPQGKTEELLRDRLRELGVEVRFGTKLDLLSKHAGGFDATLSGERRSARFVVGADGTKSFVRKELGIYSPSRTYAKVMAAVDLPSSLGLQLPRDQHYNFLGDEGLLELIPLPDGVRATMILANESGQGRLDHAKDRDRLRRFLRQAGVELDEKAAAQLPELTYFKVKERVASRYRSGNGFLVGDAAHEHGPAGAQGMNTGLADAQNLAWKLARVIRGEAKESLLDTYEAERRPVAKRVVRSTAMNTRLLGMTQTGGAVRNALLPHVMPWVQKQIAREVAQVDVSYRAACCGTGLQPGDRAPLDRELAKLLDADKGADHAFVFSKDQLEALRDRPRTVLHLIEDPQERAKLTALFGSDQMVVIRPDGYVAEP